MVASKKPSTLTGKIEEFLRDKERVKNSVSVIILVVMTAVFFFPSWADNALVVKDNSAITVDYDGTTKISTINSTITVENYYPLGDPTVHPILFKFNDTGKFQLYNDKEVLKEEQVSINSFSVKYMYGDEEVLTPFADKNLTAFIGLVVPKLTKVVMKVNWSYNYTEEDAETSSLKYIRLILTTSPDDDFRLMEAKDWLSYFVRDLVLCTFPYVVFIVAGILLSYYALEPRKLSKDYRNLTKFSQDSYSVAGEKEKKETKASLDNLIKFPDTPETTDKFITSIRKLAFGLSIVLFKSFINNICKRHHEAIDSYSKIAPYKRAKLKTSLSKYSKKTFKESLDFLPEVKTILIATGFLTSVGISLTFNVGAGLPLVFTVIVLYYFLNLGATLCLVKHSLIDFSWVLIITLISLVIIISPKLIEMYRILG